MALSEPKLEIACKELWAEVTAFVAASPMLEALCPMILLLVLELDLVPDQFAPLLPVGRIRMLSIEKL